MIIEGKGNVRPHEVMVAISSADLVYAKDIASSRNAHRGYSSSTSQWKRGSCSNPALIGTVGEIALQKYLQSRGIRCEIASDILNDGDDGIDFRFAGYKYQVKTSRQKSDPILVRRATEYGRLLPLACDRFVFCKWAESDTHCLLLGWCARQQLLDSPVDRSSIGKWFNIELSALNLLSIKHLVLAMKQEIVDVK